MAAIDQVTPLVSWEAVMAHFNEFRNRALPVVSRGQTAYFSFDIGAEKKGSGVLPLHVLCRESPDFGDC